MLSFLVNIMITETLKEIGLNEKEIEIYLTILEKGICKVEGILEKVKIPRTTIYGILDSLIKKGFVSSSYHGKIKHFQASEPKILLRLEEEKIRKLKEVIPELEKRKSIIGEKPNVEMYSGKKGIQLIYEKILETKKEILGYGNTELFDKLLEFYAPNYISRRKKQKMFFSLITNKTKESEEMKKNDEKELRKTKFISKMKNLRIGSYIFGENVAFIVFSKKEPFGVLIKNKDIADAQKEIFNLIQQNN